MYPFGLVGGCTHSGNPEFIDIEFEGGVAMLTAMTKMMKLVRVQAVAVVSVLSLVAAFLVSGVVGASQAKAASPTELTTFKIKSGTLVTTSQGEEGPSAYTWRLQPAQITNGEGTVPVAMVGHSITGKLDFSNAKATASTLTFNFLDVTVVLSGAHWGSYKGTAIVGSSPFEFSNIVLDGVPSSGSKPRAPKSVKVAGGLRAKSYKLSWKKPSTKGDRPVAGYRVLVNQKGYKNNFVDKKLSKKTLSYKISRSTLLKNAAKRSTRGEVGGTLRFRVRIFATNDAGNGEPVTSWIRVAA